MKKLQLGILASVVAAVIIVGVGVPYVQGRFAENNYRKLIEDINAKTNKQAQFKIEQYHRGWFSSQSQLTMTVIPNKAVFDQSELKFAVTQKIKHGPILITNQGIRLGQAFAASQFTLNEIARQHFSTFFTPESTQPKLKAYLFFSLLGNPELSFDVPPFHLVPKNNSKESMDWQGLSLQSHFTRNLDKAEGRVRLVGFTVQSPLFQMAMSQSILNFKQTMNNFRLWDGFADITIPMLKFNNALTHNSYDLRNANLRIETNTASERFQTQMILNFEKLLYGDRVIGPATLRAALKDVDATTLSKLQQQLKVINDPRLNAQQQKMLVVSVMPVFSELVNKGLEYQVNMFKLIVPEGNIEAKGFVRVNADNKPDAALSLASILQRIQGDFQFALPQQLAVNRLEDLFFGRLLQQQFYLRATREEGQSAPNNGPLNPQEKQLLAATSAQLKQMAKQNAADQMKLWLAKGYLIPVNNQYSLQVIYKDQALTINGKEAVGVIPFAPRKRVSAVSRGMGK